MNWPAMIMGGLVAGVTLGLVIFGGQPGHIIIGVSITIGAFVVVIQTEKKRNEEL